MSTPVPESRPVTAQERAERNFELVRKMIDDYDTDMFYGNFTYSNKVPGLAYMSDEVDGFVSIITLMEIVQDGCKSYKAGTIVTKLDLHAETVYEERIIETMYSERIFS